MIHKAVTREEEAILLGGEHHLVLQRFRGLKGHVSAATLVLPLVLHLHSLQAASLGKRT